MTTTFVNTRNGRRISTDLTHEEVCRRYAEVAPKDHWLYFWMVDAIQKSSESSSELKNAIAFVGDSFLFAIGMGLQKPMIRAQYGDRRYKMYLSRRGTLCFKAGAVQPETRKPVGNEEYIGCLWQGRILPNKRREMLPSEQDFIRLLGEDPVGFLAKCSRDMDRCSYCDRALSDARSKSIGYGKTCANRWGLAWGREYDEKIPSFADLWGRSTTDDRKNIRGLMVAIREDVQDAANWAVLGDALQDAGWTADRLPKPPEGLVTIPSL